MGKGSARTLQYWLDKGYEPNKAEEMRLSRTPGTIEYFTIFKEMDYNTAVVEREKYNKKGAVSLNNMILKYGDEIGIQKWNEYREKQSHSNSFEYKQQKYGWTREEFDEYNKSRSSIGELNGNYGSSYYESWVKKYGKDKANEMNASLGPRKAEGGKSKKGKPMSIETRKKMSESAKKRIIEQGTYRSYNSDSIPIIEQYGRENNYNFQHAENDGEFMVPNIYYYVDGYDKDKNVVIEYDEKHHKYQTQKDLIRQAGIIEELKCKFIRIKWNTEIEIFEYEG